ncbi:MAG: DUF1987 domain-containing protein [SAR324 cluster bacterium]|nr:DUF1987 domain-containing protein [SAR324 cluster bacterium]
MENLNIAATKHTPLIQFNTETHILEIRGRSYPENTFEFYEPVMKWLKEYFESTSNTTTIDFEINYFNSTSSKLFFDMFDLFVDAQENGSKIVINWEYDEEDEDSEEAGEGFQEDFDSLEINLVPK